MLSLVLDLLKDNKGVSILITALTVAVLLGATGTITLPADEKVAALEKYVQQHVAQKSQSDLAMELQQIRWRIDGVQRALRFATPEETDSLKSELEWLRQREREIISIMRGVG